MTESDKLTIKDVRLVFKNFAGARDKFGNEGKRNFNMIVPDSWAKRLEDEGVRVKYLKPRDEEDEPAPYCKVNLKFGFRPPKIVTINNGRRTILTEKTVAVLDFADVERTDLTIRLWRHDVNGTHYVTPYLEKMFVTLVPDELEELYAEPEDETADDEEIPF